MALCWLSFTSSAASNWKFPRTPGPRTSKSWGLNLRSGEAGPWPLQGPAPLLANRQPEHESPLATGNETEGKWALRR